MVFLSRINQKLKVKPLKVNLTMKIFRHNQTSSKLSSLTSRKLQRFPLINKIVIRHLTTAKNYLIKTYPICLTKKELKFQFKTLSQDCSILSHIGLVKVMTPLRLLTHSSRVLIATKTTAAVSVPRINEDRDLASIQVNPACLATAKNSSNSFCRFRAATTSICLSRIQPILTPRNLKIIQ